MTEWPAWRRRPVVPFLDLGRIHAAQHEELLSDIGALLRTGAFSNGPQVAAFEREFARYCDRSYAVGVASGLDGLRLALLALEIGPGDEVIVPAQTFVATYEAVIQVGATPVVVDIRADDFTLDPTLTEAALTERTRCLLPVDLYGQLADLPALRGIADRRGLVLVEDACQAHGARRDGLSAGGLADAAAFSFYPAKNLGALGDAGAIVTNNEQVETVVRQLREHGQQAKYDHEQIGWTSRLDTLQAVVLLRKLPHLDEWNKARRRVALRYLEELADVGDLELPSVLPGSEPAWHLFVVLTDRPDELASFLAERGVQTGRHYPKPPHCTAAYAGLGHASGSFPVAERLASRCLSLPIFPGMTNAEIDAVVSGVQAYFDRRSRKHRPGSARAKSPIST